MNGKRKPTRLEMHEKGLRISSKWIIREDQDDREKSDPESTDEEPIEE